MRNCRSNKIDSRTPAVVTDQATTSTPTQVTPAHHEDHTADESTSLLAWAGWQLDMPSEWFPLKLKGNAEKGSMMVGDDACAMFSLHWDRPGRKSVSDGQLWVDKRLKKLGLLPDQAPPAASNFTTCGWAYGVQSEEDKQTTYWFGYSEPAQLLLGVKVNGVLPQAQRDHITDHILPSLRATAADAETIWSMYNVSFVSPGGFRLFRKRLFAGDVVLEFIRGERERLMLRQVYPGKLALSRRSFDRWLEANPFLERRRLRKSSVTTEPWRHATHEGMTGTRRRGRKCIGFPLGFIRPLWTDACAVHDQVMDRLLIAEHLSPNDRDASVSETAVLQMNQPQLKEIDRGGD